MKMGGGFMTNKCILEMEVCPKQTKAFAKKILRDHLPCNLLCLHLKSRFSMLYLYFNLVRGKHICLIV